MAPSEGIAPEAFPQAYSEALRERGIDGTQLNDTIQSIFHGKEDAYKRLVSHLDSMPPGVMLRAYVRCAEAVIQFARLAQSQS